MSNTDDDVIMEQNWYEDNEQAKWMYQEVPEGKNIVGYYGRVESEVIVSLGFIVI